MVAPTVSSVTPAKGHPAGGYVLVITGTDFDVPTVPTPTSLPVAAPTPTISVTVDGYDAENIDVWSSTLITCLCPRFQGSSSDLSADPGHAVDVVVGNLGPPLEETTESALFAYAREDFTRSEGVLRHVIRTIISELRRQVLDNVAVYTHIDYDGNTADGLDIVEHAEIPSIAIDGPDVRDDPIRQKQGYSSTQDLGALEFTETRQPRAQILSFTVDIVGRTFGEALSIAQEFTLFFTRTPELQVALDDQDPDSEDVPFQIYLSSPPSRTGNANAAGTVTFSAEFEIHGIEIDDDDKISVNWGEVLDDPADVETRPIDQEF